MNVKRKTNFTAVGRLCVCVLRQHVKYLLNAIKRLVWIRTRSLWSFLRRSSFFLAVLWTVRSSGEALQFWLALALIRFLALLCSSVVDGNSTEHTSNSAVRLGVLGLAVKPPLLTTRKSVAVSVCADKASSMTLRNSCWTCFWGSGVLGTRVVLREERVDLDDVFGLAITADSTASPDTCCPLVRKDRATPPFLLCAK